MSDDSYQVLVIKNAIEKWLESVVDEYGEVLRQEWKANGFTSVFPDPKLVYSNKFLLEQAVKKYLRMNPDADNLLVVEAVSELREQLDTDTKFQQALRGYRGLR